MKKAPMCADIQAGKISNAETGLHRGQDTLKNPPTSNLKERRGKIQQTVF